MNLTLGSHRARANSKDGFDALVKLYLDRCSAFARCQAEAFRGEEAFLDWLSRQQGRTAALPVLFDSRGKQMTSEAFASWLGARRDEGYSTWSSPSAPRTDGPKAARERAQLLLSAGAYDTGPCARRLVVAEQLYRHLQFSLATLSRRPLTEGNGQWSSDQLSVDSPHFATDLEERPKMAGDS